MKSQRAIAYIVLAAVIGIGAVGLRVAWAQDDASATADATATADAPAILGVAVSEAEAAARSSGVARDEMLKGAKELRKAAEKMRTYQHAISIHMPGHESIDGKIREAAEKLRDAEGDEAKANARKKLIDILGKCFDEDMGRREQELAKLEERLSKLRAQLEHRRAKRQEIIDLQVQVAVNEADGLGFLSRPSTGQLDPFVLPYGSHTMHLSNGDASITLPMPPIPPDPQPFVDSEDGDD